MKDAKEMPVKMYYLPAKIQAHVRNQEELMLDTFESNTPAKQKMMLWKGEDSNGQCNWILILKISTTKISVLEKQSTITPTNFVSVIPLQKHNTVKHWYRNGNVKSEKFLLLNQASFSTEDVLREA